MPSAFSQSLRRLITNIPLRWILTVPFVLPTIGAVALVGYMSYQSGQRAVTDLAAQLMQEKGDQVALYLERTLEAPHLVNQLNADSIRLGQLPGLETQDPAPLEKLLWAQLLRFSDVTSIAFANERGGMIGSGRLYQPQSIVMSVYRTAQFARGTYSLSTTDAQGNILETKVIAQNYDARTRPWYQTPVQTGKATWSPIYQYVSHLDTLGISAGLPIYKTSGKLQGVLTADINLKKLDEFLSGLRISSSGQVFIIERSGLLVASSTNQSLFTTQAEKGERLKAGESANPTMREIMAALATRFGNLTDIETTQQFTIKQAKSPKLVQVIPFQDRYGLDWLIVTVIPESDFMAAIHANRDTTVLLCLLTLGGAIGLGIIAANRLVTRFAQLNQVSRELAAGNLDQRLPTDGLIYELNGLAQTFNQMADQLQQSFDRLRTALVESEEKFTIIFHANPEPIVLVTMSEERCVEANESFLNLLKYAREALIGQRFLDLGFWGNLEERAYFRNLLQRHGQVRNLEVQLITRTEQMRTVLLSAERIEINGEVYSLSIVKDISDRKATELALQQSEARYRAIVEDQTEVICRALPDTILVFVNDAYCRYFGVKREEVIGKQHYGCIHPEDQDRVNRVMRSLSLHNPTVTTENRVVVDGDIRWTQWINRLLFDRQGNVTEIQSVGRDITQLKQIEEALRKREAQLLQAQRIAHVGSWEFDLATQQITWSEELFQIFGLDSSQLEPSYAEILEIIPAAERSIVNAAVEQAIADGTPYEVEHRICRLDGTIRHIISKGQPALNDRQQVLKLYGTALDITDRKTAEISFQQYGRIVSATSDAISLVDCQYRYQIVNQAYLDWNHKSDTEIIGHSVSELVGQEVFETMVQPYLDRCFTGETIQYSEWFEYPGLGRQFVSVTYSPYLEIDQTISGAVVSVRNITPLKQAELALQESEARFQEIAQTLNQVSYVVSLTTGQYLYISPSYERLWGYSCESLYQDPRSWLERIHPEDAAYVLWGFNQLLSGNQVCLEYRIFSSDGEIHWIKSESLVVYDEDGNPLRMVGLADDITDRKHLEQSLRSQAEQERLLATITQNIRQSLDLEQILATTVIEVQQTLNADRVLIFQLNPDGSGQVIQEAVVPEYPVTDQMRWEDEHFPEDCHKYYQQGNPRIVPDVATDAWASCLTKFMQDASVKSKVVAPIVQICEASTAKIWGLLIVHACSDYRQWQASEADFLQRICNQLAIAINQANLYQQLQLELAERRQAEENVRYSEARLAIAQQVAQVGYWEVDLESQTRTWSELAFHQWGRDPTQSEPTLAELLDMVHPDDRVALQQSREKTITEKIPYVLDLRVVHPDGSIRYLESRARPVLNPQGKVVKLIGTSVDITERKQTEKALQEREAMLRAIGDNLPKGFIYQRVYEPDRGSYYSYISAGVERLLGIKPEAVLADPKIMQSIGFDEDLAMATQIVEESLRNLSVIEIQMRNRTAQGDIQWSSIRSTPRRLEDGRTVWDGVEVDITDLKRVESALRVSEEQFRRAFGDAPIGISLVSPTGQFVKVNTCYCDLLEYTEAELLAITFQEITHPADLEVDLKSFQQIVSGEVRSYQVEKRYITKQGTVIPVVINAASIRDQNGQLLYCVGHVRDIRDRLKVERMKDEFISVVSHELRTPLTSIQGALGILGSGVFNNRPEKAQHMLQIAINNSDRLVRLVNDILTLERLESGKVQLVMEHCQVTTLMQQAIDSVQMIADQSGITLCLDSVQITWWADPDAMIQTLTNLLSNAIKFSAPGDTVWLKAELEEIGNLEKIEPSRILFTVKDQGRGIPQDKLEIIFDQFQQVDVSDSRQKGGTGLGLAICKNIVQQHGGRIWVKSNLGEGSSFYVMLPLNSQHVSHSTDSDCE